MKAMNLPICQEVWLWGRVKREGAAAVERRAQVDFALLFFNI